jgi:hypothetical protein
MKNTLSLHRKIPLLGLSIQDDNHFSLFPNNLIMSLRFGSNQSQGRGRSLQGRAPSRAQYALVKTWLISKKRSFKII